MAKKSRKIKKRKVCLLFILFIVICLFFVFIVKKGSNKPVASEVEVIDTIDDFDYQLNDNNTKYYNELFSKLKELLSSDDYDESEYAVLVGQLFLSDFYDLNSKVMKSDVGGTQFVYESYRSDFELGAIDSVYKFVESNVYGDRKQALPAVKYVEMSNISNNNYRYDGNVDNNAYYLDLSITYDKDLGYPNDVTLVMVHIGDKLEIVEMSSE